MTLAIDWAYGRPHTGADDDAARALAAAQAVLDAAGVADHVAAEAAYIAAVDAGAELAGDAAAWHAATCAANIAATEGWYNSAGASVALRAWESAGATALRAAGFAVGDRIQAGRGGDHDTGRIAATIDGRVCRVAWDSGVATPCAVEDLRPAD